jgi:hypothetical protein
VGKTKQTTCRAIKVRPDCPGCRGRLLWESIGGVLVIWRDVAGRKVYDAVCESCRSSYEVDGGRA